MSEGNVTPIKPPTRRQLRRAAGLRKGLLLRDCDESDGFTTLDLVNGLQAVCVAIDESAGGTHDVDHVHRLSMAAKILSTMVADRVEI